MSYTNQKYAEMAAKANKENKKLVDNNGVLELHEIIRSEEEITASNKSIIQSLIQEATLQINILQDTIDLEMTTNGEADQLKAWKRYRILLTRVDTSLEEMELPTKPE